MHLYYNDINDAFHGLVQGMHTGYFPSSAENLSKIQPGPKVHNGTDFSKMDAVSIPNITRSPSRNGDVITVEEPATITYLNPLNRVLMNPVRDCNPFFHVIEAMWMLAGRRDIAPLVHFNSEMAKFSDDGETFHAAYGDRWRNYFGVEAGDQPWVPHDQLEDIIDILSKDKTSRRVVLEMWSNGDLRRQIEYPQAKDLPCNLLAMFRVRKADAPGPETPPGVIPNPYTPWQNSYLDMTVVNRSNDMLLGMCGANYVHFSYLQEYIALAIGAAVGYYHQITNNLHVYTSPKEEGSPWLPGKCDPEAMLKTQGYYPTDTEVDRVPLYTDREKFDQELTAFFQHNAWKADNSRDILPYGSMYFSHIINPLVLAFNYHKKRDYSRAQKYAAMIQQTDWRADCLRWLNLREARYNKAADDGPHPQG